MSAKRKSNLPFGLSRPALIAAAGLLVGVGLAAGIALDIALRPSAVVRPQSAPRPTPRPVPPIVVRNTLPQEEPPSLFTASPPEPEPKAAPHKASPPEILRRDGTPPMVAFAVPSSAPPHQPVLAIVIDDMGLDRSRTLKILALPGPLTVSLMTYADDLAGLVNRARAGGHEVMAHVPMEPLSRKEDPGPHALTVAMDDDAIRAALAGDLDRWQGYVGVNNHMGSRFTMDKARMAVVMSELKSRGLLWLDSKTTNDSVGPAVARDAGVAALERDVFLDNVDTAAAVEDQFDRTIATALSRGSAIAIGHPHDNTIAVLTRRLPGLEQRGVALVPVTEILKRRRKAPI